MPEEIVHPGSGGDFDLYKAARIRTKKIILATYVIFLCVLHVTIVIVLASLGDFVSVFIISALEGNPANQSETIKQVLEAIKTFSVYGTATLYTIYLLYSLFDSIKHVTKMLFGKEV